MTPLPLLDPDGVTVGRAAVAEVIAGQPIKQHLIHETVVAELAARRAGTHSTKTRGVVRGGGAKPWRQKGTGRARQGSIRSPQWVGGGVAHGPHPRGHDMRVNKKMRKGALRSALTDALRSGKLAVVRGLELDEPKTKRAVQLLTALDLNGKVLVVLREPTTTLAVEKSFRNLTNVRVAYAGGLGVYEVIAADRVLLTEGALDALAGAARPSAETAGEESSG